MSVTDEPLRLRAASVDADQVDLHAILRTAVERGASDVHLKVGQPPIIRFDGELEPLIGWTPLGVPALEDVLEEVGASAPGRASAFEQTGELDTAYQAFGLPRFRVNAFRQRGDISFAFRVIPRKIPDFAGLGLPSGVARLAEEQRGLVLVTGATGSGKTTTLAAILGHINRTRRQHIVTIEDPIEILHDDESCIVNQREIGLDTDSFQEALRRALRQDPDVILIGELRDSETAETALQAAESGHLVLSTMHTVDAAETVSRLVEFFPAIKQPQVRAILAGVLRGVISQRLLPRRDGGRVAAVEVMVANARLQELIRENKAEFIPEAIGEGAFFEMQTLTAALIDLVLRGEVDEDTAAGAAPNAHDFAIALGKALKERAAQERATEAEAEEPEPEPGGRVVSVSPPGSSGAEGLGLV
jgi:twitching motility protein PilT